MLNPILHDDELRERRSRLTEKISSSKNSLDAKRNIRACKYRLIQAEYSREEQKRFWKNVKSLYSSTEIQLDIPSELAAAAQQETQRMAEEKGPSTKLELHMTFPGDRDRAPSFLQKLDTVLQSHGLGHITEHSHEEEKIEVAGLVYTDPEDVQAVAGVLNREDAVADFQVFERTGDGTRLCYYTEPMFPNDGYRKYDEYDRFELHGRFIFDLEERPVSVFQVYATKEDHGTPSCFTQKAEKAHVEIADEPIGEIERQLRLIAQQEAVRRIDEGEFVHDEVYTCTHSEMTGS